MKKIITFLSIILIIMSIVLLLVTPAAVIGIVLGVFGIIYGRYYEKHSEEIKAISKASLDESKELWKEATSKPENEAASNESSNRVFHFVEKIPVSSVDFGSIEPYLVGEEDIERETVMVYERGDKIFRNVYSFESATITVSGKDVLVNGEAFGHFLPKNLEKYQYYVSTYPEAWLSLDVQYGHYAKIVRNLDYDSEYDDEYGKNYVEYDQLEKPCATLSIHYATERNPS